MTTTDLSGPLAAFAREHLPEGAELQRDRIPGGYTLRAHCPACIADAAADGSDDGTAGMLALRFTDAGHGPDVRCYDAGLDAAHTARALGFADAFGFEVALLGVGGGASSVGAPAWSLLRTLGDLADLPAPEPLIAETLDRRTLALLAGRHGTGKSFFALDWAACIATGTPWQGRSTRRGRVLYVPGEGVYGLRDRLSAWQQHHGVVIDPSSFHLTAAAPRLADVADVELLRSMVRAESYDLVVIDTLARAAVGVDENSAKEMGVVIAAAGAVKADLDGGTVLLVHHTGKNGETVRGSSALEGAVDTAYLAEGDPERGVKVSRTKRKDGRREDVHRLRLSPVGPSVVLEAVDGTELVDEDGSADPVTVAHRMLLARFGGQAGGFARADAVSVLLTTGTSVRTVNRRINDLKRRHLLREPRPGWLVLEVASAPASGPEAPSPFL